jgi:hypothetical protein
MSDLPEIITSGSAFKSYQACPRRRWWEYEAPSGESTRGWEPNRLSLPLSTGGWCHRVVEGLALLSTGGDLGRWFDNLDFAIGAIPRDAHDVIECAVLGYRTDVRTRSLDLGLSLDGMVEEEKFIERTIEEQAALLEAFGWAYARVRLPRILDEYEIVSIEQEGFTLLSGDVGLQTREDMTLRRRLDGRLFVYNLKTSSSTSDKRWKDQWEVDQQLMTETLAVERRMGEPIYGVIIDGFDKGPRINVWWDDLKECRGEKPGAFKWQAQRNRLIYGYKCEILPGRTDYDWEGTTRKGWGKFAVWESERTIEDWVNWLPTEVVEAQFVTLPPILRSQQHVESKVRQIVAQEQNIRASRKSMDANPAYNVEQLDAYFPQSEHACTYPTRCPMYRLCWEEGAADDPGSNGYVPRQPNHPSMEGE